MNHISIINHVPTYVWVVLAILACGGFAVLVATLLKSASLNDRFIEPEDLMDRATKDCPKCNRPMTFRKAGDLEGEYFHQPWWHCDNCRHDEPIDLPQATVRGTDGSHKPEQRGATPRPATNFPRYFDSAHGFGDTAAYIVAKSPDDVFVVRRNGTEFRHWTLKDCEEMTEAGVWKEITEPEAKALITLPSPQGLVAPRETEAGC